MGRVVAKYEGDGNRDKALAIITDNGFKIKEFIGPLREPEHSHFELIVDDKGAYISGHPSRQPKHFSFTGCRSNRCQGSLVIES